LTNPSAGRITRISARSIQTSAGRGRSLSLTTGDDARRRLLDAPLAEALAPVEG
jgi:hypothetical protein